MFVNIAGREATSSITDKDTAPEDIQPNAIDLRVERILRIRDLPFVVSEDVKIHRGAEEIAPEWRSPPNWLIPPNQKITEDFWWKLSPGSYEIVMEGKVKMGPDELGWVIPRSTLNRNGLFLTSGLYDSGYHGVMAACLHITGMDDTWIQKGTRVGQFILAKAESVRLYAGSYGINSEHDKAKYGA